MQEEFSIEEYEKEKSKKGRKIESFLESRYFIALIFILVSISSFCLGRLSKIEDMKRGVRVVSESKLGAVGEVKGASMSIEAKEDVVGGGTIVASKNGTKYHLSSCAGAKQISEKNKITFNSIEAARAAGYTPAANCKGLK